MSFSFHELTQSNPYIIAEAGVNHDGCLDNAIALVDAAKKANADAIKFQLFDAKSLTTVHAEKARYQTLNDTDMDAAETQQTMLERLSLSKEDMLTLSAYAASQHIDFLCSPFDADSADALASQFGLPFIKFGSGELNNFPLLKRVAAKRIPLLLSTGMATMSDVRNTMHFLDSFYGKSFSDSVALMHCTSQYPAPYESLNLRAIQTLQDAFPRHVIGYSDHSMSFATVPAIATALGAKIYEKHLTLDATSTAGPDHAASIEPTQFAFLVESIHDALAPLGNGEKVPHACELDTLAVARKSIVTTRDMTAGEAFREADITTKRPGTGIPAHLYFKVLGKTLTRDVVADTVLNHNDVV